MVAVGGKLLGVGFRHDLAGCILDEHAPDRAALQGFCHRREALFCQVGKDSHEKGGGCGTDAFVHGLAGHGEWNPVLEITHDLVEGCLAGNHCGEKGLYEASGGEAGGFPDNKGSFGCDQVEIRQDDF